MIFNFEKFSLTADLERGEITSLAINGKERVASPSELFRIRLRDREGKELLLSSREAKICQVTDDGAIYSGFCADVSVKVSMKNENGEAASRISVIHNGEDFFTEWVDFPNITLPMLEKNNRDGNGGKILFPYNEGALVSDIDEREESPLCYAEPEYPSRGSYAMFPNMVCSQMLAYLWEDVGLYIGAHDEKRGVKDINFYKSENGVTLRFRIFCGKDFGETFETDYPMISSVTDSRWESAAERYRKWFEGALPAGAVKITENKNLPEWYADSPLVVSYPIRGTHDKDEMKPNKLYPYTNALPLLDEIKETVDSRLLVLLMHWEGTAPWAPPYVLPPYGDAENFEEFKKALHKNRDMLGVYCSGFGYTAQSNLVHSYNKEQEYKERDLERGMCADTDGKVKISEICTGQRSGYDICPASEVGREILKEAYTPLLETDIDYAQILDQNHGGGQYFCYSKEHGHPPAPGAWMTENMQELLSEWNLVADKTLLGCESAAAEPYIGNLLYSDNRFELNYRLGIPVPLYSYIYHEYVRNFMGNQVSCPFVIEADTLRHRLAYSFCAGDSMTLVLTENGELASYWGQKDFSCFPNKEKALVFIKNLTRAYKDGAKKYLYAGRMIASPEVKCEKISFAKRLSEYSVEISALAWTAWEAEDRSRALIIVNPEDRDICCEVDGKEITVSALSSKMIEL